MTAIQAIMGVIDVGGGLAPDGEGLILKLPKQGTPPGLRDAVVANKPSILAILTGPPFLIVRSDLLPGETLLWATDAQGRDLLEQGGADPGVVYTRTELGVLLRKHPSAMDLIAIHSAKRKFNGRICAD